MASIDSPLYGGAITTRIPSRFIDASNLRQVPDNQEVFIDREKDESLIVEILELCSDVTEDEAVTFHFTDLADHNQALEREVVAVRKLDTSLIPGLRPGSSAHILHGLQKVAKFNESGPGAQNVVHLVMICLRVPSVETDLLLTYNRPIDIGPLSSSASSLASSGMPGSGTVVSPAALEEAERVLLGVWEPFRICDWNLFG